MTGKVIMGVDEVSGGTAGNICLKNGCEWGFYRVTTLCVHCF